MIADASPLPKKYTDAVKDGSIDSLFYTLSASQLARALTAALPQEGLSPEQQLYARAVLLNTAHTGAAVLSEEASLRGTVARMASPAYSKSRVGAYESAIYDLIEAGDADSLKAIVKPQIMTTTAHPNFSRSRELVMLSQQISKAIGALKPEDQTEIQRTGLLPKTQEGDAITALIGELKTKLHKREKRTRRDEMNETMIDFIPTVMEAADEQIDLFKKRKKTLSGASSDDIDNEKAAELRAEYGFNESQSKHRKNEKKYAEFLKDRSSETASWNFTSTKQLDAAALLLPHYNSWGISDGDGKRTCHVYDTEMAIPALKRATLKTYRQTLEKLHAKEFGGMKVGDWVNRLKQAEDSLEKVEKLASLRVDTVSAIQYIGATYPETTDDAREKREKALNATKLRDLDDSEISKTLRETFPDLTLMEAAKKISSEYKTLITQDAVKEALGSMPVREGKNLPKDLAQELKTKLNAALEQAYQDPQKRDGDVDLAESLYIKVSAYGNFAMRMQRRENAKEYTDTLYYLLQSTDIKEKIAQQLGRPKEDLDETKLKASNELYDQVINAMAESALSAGDPLDIKKHIQDQFIALSNKMESRINDKTPFTPDNMAVGTLQPRELLAVDDLGFFNMARRYPEAFDGFVIAEYAQPKDMLLRDGTDTQVREEVQRMAQAEFLTSLTFAHAMKAENAEIIPLHEDPATMRWIPSAQSMLRAGPMREYMLHFMGLDGDNAEELAEQKAIRYIDVSPLMQDTLDKTDSPTWDVASSVKKLTAYDEMRRLGYDDETLKKEVGDIAKLQNMFILDGPTDMEACSDNSKRAGIVGAELAEQSVRDKALEAAKNPVTIGGQLYMIRKPKYLGQGGAIARATEIPLDSVQATWQGEHSLSFVPKALAHKMYNFMLGRLYLNGEAGRADVPSEHMQQLAAGNPLYFKGKDESPLLPLNVPLMGSGNMFGLSNYGMSPTQKNMMNEIILQRVKSTRDDPRYDAFLAKYGSPALNYSARPPSKGAGTFSDKRAIGIAAEEAPMFSNTIALAAMLGAGTKDDAAYGIPHQSNIEDIRKWKDKDYSIQQRLTAAALVSYYANAEKTWERGEGAYNLTPEEITAQKAEFARLQGRRPEVEDLIANKQGSPLDEIFEWALIGLGIKTKEAQEKAQQTTASDTFVYDAEAQSVSLKKHPEKGSVSIRELARAYDDKKQNYTDEKTGIIFDAADLVMAHLTEQQMQLQEGLKQIYPGKKDMLSMFDPAHQEDIKATKVLYDDVLTRLNETKPKNGEKKSKDRELLEGAYYLLFESGPGTIYPLTRLADKNMQLKHAEHVHSLAG